MKTIKEYIESIEDKISNIESNNNIRYAELDAKLDSILKVLYSIKDYQEGNWEIKDNQMIFYGKDNNIIARYNLYDKTGNLNEQSVYKRVKIE